MRKMFNLVIFTIFLFFVLFVVDIVLFKVVLAFYNCVALITVGSDHIGHKRYRPQLYQSQQDDIGHSQKP